MVNLSTYGALDNTCKCFFSSQFELEVSNGNTLLYV